MVSFKKLFAAVLFDYRKERAIRRAQKEADRHRRKYLVLVAGGKPHVISLQMVKLLIRKHRFIKGFTAEKARQIAIFEAIPRPLKKV